MASGERPGHEMERRELRLPAAVQTTIPFAVILPISEQAGQSPLHQCGSLLSSFWRLMFTPWTEYCRVSTRSRAFTRAPVLLALLCFLTTLRLTRPIFGA